MTDIPTFAIPPSFLGLTRRDPSAAIAIAGIPFDLGTSNRPGARFGPAAIRPASRMLVDGAHPANGVDPARLDVADVGDFAIAHGDISGSLAKIEAQAAMFDHLAALGGDHTVTLGLLRALAKRRGPLALVHFDAHVDTWPESFGLAWGHGSPLSREVHDWTRNQGVTIVSAEEVHDSGPAAIAERIRAVIGEATAYLTFDIDALDPAFAPGTGTPEIGGLATWQARAILRRLAGLDFAGMDVVEVAPPYDVAEITALAAATIVWDYLALLAPRR